MENTQINNKIGHIKNININAILKQIAICFFSFICGGTNVFNIFSPFGISFCTLFFNEGIIFYFTVLSFIFGRITIGNNILNIKYIIWSILISILNFTLEKYFNEKYMWQKSFCTSISIFCSGIIVSLLNGISHYIIITSFIESISVFIFSFIMLKGFKTIKDSPKRKILSTEETLSLLIVLTICIMAFGDIEIWDINIKISLCILISLLSGYRLGASGGALAGGFMGFILMICFEGDSNLLSILTVSGMVSGLLMKKGKLIVSLSFFAVSSTMVFYINTQFANISWFKSMILGILMFYTISEKSFEFIYKYNINNLVYEERYYNILKQKTEYKLEECSNSFFTLSKAFKKLNDIKKTDINIVKSVIDEVGEKICKNCGLFSYCWEKDFYNTYKSFYDCTLLCESKGQIFKTDFNDEFIKNCAKIMTIISEINKYYGEYRSKIYWENKLNESRELVSEQLFSLGKIIENIKNDIDIKQIFREDIENDIKAFFDSINIKFEYVNVTENCDKEIKIIFKLKNINDANKIFFDETTKLINKITGKKMRRYNNFDNSEIIYRESKRFNVLSSSAVFCKKGNNISGDNFTFLELSDNKNLIALSDGMGSGEKANRESFFTIELLEKFLKSGFEIDIAIKLINSMLLMNSTNDSFATLDICIIDTYNKKAEFIKTGAASSYILRKNKIFAIRQESLPIGVFSKTEIERSTYDIYDGDMIIMITDGIEDIIEKNIGGDEKWLESILLSFKRYNPKDMSDYIIKEAIKKTGGEINDDMTIVVSRIWEGL